MDGREAKGASALQFSSEMALKKKKKTAAEK
jgi:hypothetical protein